MSAFIPCLWYCFKAHSPVDLIKPFAMIVLHPSIELNPEASVILDRFHQYPTQTIEEHQSFLLDLIHSFDDRTTDTETLIQRFTPYAIEQLVEYLRNSHRHYLDKLLPEIEQRISSIANQTPAGHPARTLVLWFSFFKGEFMEHMLREEMYLFPYALAIDKGVQDEAYSAVSFLYDHVDHDDQLNKMIQSGLLNEEDAIHRMVKAKLELLRADLTLHGLIEEQVLVRKIMELER